MLPSCFFMQFLEQLLKFLSNFTLLKYVKSQRSYGLNPTYSIRTWLVLRAHTNTNVTFLVAPVFFEPAFGLRPNEKQDGMICLGCVRAVYKWRKSGKPINQVGTQFLHAVSSISVQSLFMTHLRHLQSHGCVV